MLGFQRLSATGFGVDLHKKFTADRFSWVVHGSVLSIGRLQVKENGSDDLGVIDLLGYIWEQFLDRHIDLRCCR
jgi:hypothetical protein